MERRQSFVQALTSLWLYDPFTFREEERERERAFKVELAESHENTMRLRTTHARR